MKSYLIILALFVLLTGCGKVTQKKETTPKKKSNAAILVDGLTGRTAVKQGKKAMNTIKTVSKQKDQDLEEIN